MGNIISQLWFPLWPGKAPDLEIYLIKLNILIINANKTQNGTIQTYCFTLECARSCNIIYNTTELEQLWKICYEKDNRNSVLRKMAAEYILTEKFLQLGIPCWNILEKRVLKRHKAR